MHTESNFHTTAHKTAVIIKDEVSGKNAAASGINHKVQKTVQAVQMAAQASAAGQYSEKRITIYQTLNGEQYLSQGGSKFIDDIFQDLNLKNKKVLDFGCGLCGPAEHLVKKYGAVVNGVDIDPYLLSNAQSKIKEHNLESSIILTQVVSASQIPLPDATFDVVFSKEAIIHVQHKDALFKEFYRLLKPGGVLIIVDWFKRDEQVDLQFDQSRPDALKFHYCIKELYKKMLSDAQFEITDIIETSKLYEKFTEKYHQDLMKEKGQVIKALFGDETLQQSIKNCVSHLQTLKSKKIQTFLFKAKRK